MENFYETLEIPNFSPREEVKKAYISLCLKWHPDKNANTNKEIFYKIQNAYQILYKQSIKQKYDSFLESNSVKFAIFRGINELATWRRICKF